MNSSLRPRTNWSDPENPFELPAPWAEKDVIEIPEGARALERMDGMPPGRYKIVYATSIDEGDAWYFRVAKYLTRGPCSGRLHVAFHGRCTWDDDQCVNWLESCTLVRTEDPEGLALREQMLADGWTFTPPDVCSECGRRKP